MDQARTGRGGPIVYWRGSRMQRGSGIGTVLQGIFKSPIVRKGMKYMANTGLSTAGDVLSGLIDGQSLKNASKAVCQDNLRFKKRKL